MTFKKLLIANRGEIAVRLIRAAADMGLATVAVHGCDDAQALHVRMADEAVQMPLQGPAAYLDINALVGAAIARGCDAVHPGYGFLSESAAFAAAMTEAGVCFVGPPPEQLDLFGDKSKALALARECHVPVLEGTSGATTLAQANDFMAGLPAEQALMVKAIAGGGGRGMRIVHSADQLPEAFERCASEALKAFGCGDLYVERFVPRARHIEVQVVGDGREAMHLGERECSLQRRNQKLVEIAPSPSLPEALRETLCEAALRMARTARYRSLGTFEFLVAVDENTMPTGEFAFIEVNPRLQVEHTVTEAVMGVDLVRLQLAIADGATLAEAGLRTQPVAHGHAIELRIATETLSADGSARPHSGTLEAFDLPSGPGVRVDTSGYAGYATNPRYDSLLAKLIVHTPSGDYAQATRRAARALAEFRIAGVVTNQPLLRRLLANDEVRRNAVWTRWLDERLPALLADDAPGLRDRFVPVADTAGGAVAGLTRTDPLAVFGGGSATRRSAPAVDVPDGAVPVPAPHQGTVIAIQAHAGDQVRVGQTLLVLEAMKMEHVVSAPRAGTVCHIGVALNETALEGELLAWLLPVDGDSSDLEQAGEQDVDHVRADLTEVLARRAALLDAQRPDAVARRHATGRRTARENIADLCDPGSFVEYGGLAVASQRSRRSLDELRRVSPADGLITGLATVNSAMFGPERARCAVMSYDYTVFAGTQGVTNHRKTDRLLALAQQWQMPTLMFVEGGGGRPGDDWPTPAGLDTHTFTKLGALSGLVPTVAIVAGRCFAGNAALAGVCDLIIATQDANLGMGGPAMIEGGGLGVYRPEDVGPMDVQVPNGVVDLLVADEAAAVASTQQYLAYFQGPLDHWEGPDPRRLRHAVPENRLRAYDVRKVIHGLADVSSVLELRAQYGFGMITALMRIEGRSCGVIANNPLHLGGAIDAEAADKAARMIRLCDAFDLPLLSLCDTPGMMVGPEVEKTAQVRHVSRMFVAAANADVPMFTVVLRKGYGLGALAMAGGSSQASARIVAWPTGEFGPMGLEGGVKLAYRKEMQAINDPAERKAWFDAKVAAEYEQNKALSSATYLEIDDVIDPAETRVELAQVLLGLQRPLPRRGKKRAMVDVW